ncbi:hypothetical protein pb186bvf_017626 [Paramecium bursaria]
MRIGQLTINNNSMMDYQSHLQNISTSSYHIEQAAKYFVSYPDQASVLIEEWYNYLQFSKGQQDGENQVIGLLALAQRVLDTMRDNALIKEQFKRTITKAFLYIVNQSFMPPTINSQIIKVIEKWAEIKLFTHEDIKSFYEIIDPTQKNNKEKHFPPPSYLVNLANAQKELNKKILNQQNVTSKLNEILQNPNSDKIIQYDILLADLQNANDSIKKHRELVLKEMYDELKELDKLHHKLVIDLKYISQKYDDLTTKKEQMEKQNVYYIV